MKLRGESGFTLIELMMVLVIIGIFAVVTIPHLVEQRQRNVLTDFTNMLEQTAAETRVLAMQTRRATVMEFDGDEVWISTMDTSNCWGNIAQYRIQNKGQTADDSGENFFNLKASEYVHSKVFICDVRAAMITGTGVCGESSLALGGSFAMCYSGKGDLYIRDKADPGTPNRLDWKKACANWAPGGDGQDGGEGQAMSYSGAMIRVNRFEDDTGGTCPLGAAASEKAIGVTREIHVPAGAAPFGRVGI